MDLKTRTPLPAELLNIIATNVLRPQDVLALVLVCHSFYDAIAPYNLHYAVIQANIHDAKMWNHLSANLTSNLRVDSVRRLRLGGPDLVVSRKRHPVFQQIPPLPPSEVDLPSLGFLQPKLVELMHGLQSLHWENHDVIAPSQFPARYSDTIWDTLFSKCHNLKEVKTSGLFCCGHDHGYPAMLPTTPSKLYQPSGLTTFHHTPRCSFAHDSLDVCSSTALCHMIANSLLLQSLHLHVKWPILLSFDGIRDARLPHLTSLSLSGVMFDDDDCLPLFEFLSNCPNITSLSLGTCALPNWFYPPVEGPFLPNLRSFHSTDHRCAELFICYLKRNGGGRLQEIGLVGICLSHRSPPLRLNGGLLPGLQTLRITGERGEGCVWADLIEEIAGLGPELRCLSVNVTPKMKFKLPGATGRTIEEWISPLSNLSPQLEVLIPPQQMWDGLCMGSKTGRSRQRSMNFLIKIVPRLRCLRHKSFAVLIGRNSPPGENRLSYSEVVDQGRVGAVAWTMYSGLAESDLSFDEELPTDRILGL